MADILHCIYTGNVQISSQENAENLIATADYLLLSNLKTIAGKFFAQHLNTENCISIYYSIAKLYLCEELIASARKFINSNFTAVAASLEFLNLPSHEVEKWISSDEIVIDAEENVYEFILRWIDHNKSERSVKFGELFRHVRLTTISRDILLSVVVTNELVNENKDCLDSVTAALEWFDLPTGHHVPRPHSPRTTLELSVMVITLYNRRERDFRTFYLPSTDEWYRLPAHAQKHCLVTHVFSCQGKVFVVTGDLSRSQCYDPDLNQWSAAPWTTAANQEFISYANENFLQHVLVVSNKICFIVEDEMGMASLWTYNPDAKSMVPLFDWVKKIFFVLWLLTDPYMLSVENRRTHCTCFTRLTSQSVHDLTPRANGMK